MTVRIEGMGWLGSLLARTLEEEWTPFTWTDNHGPNAWGASTGCVYPVGVRDEDADFLSYVAWNDWYREGYPYGLGPHVEPGTFTFNHKNAPHGSRLMTFEIEGWGGALRKIIPPSFHVNVRDYVRATRQRFAHLEVDRVVPLTIDIAVVAHGFERAESLVWGWSTPVRLELDPILQTKPRLCLYLKPHRFELAYAYPIPGRPEWWWAGSSMIPMQEARPKPQGYLDGLLEKWVTTTTKLTSGLVRIAEVDRGGTRQGWRPKRSGESTAPQIDQDNRRIVAPALGPNGVRLAPEALDGLLGAIRSLS